jgi:ABC-type glycerol-3-phosphate transport system substrate-binding protein
MLALRYAALTALTAIVLVALQTTTACAADAATTQPAANGDASGTWKWEMPGRGGDPVEVVLKIKQQDDKITGTITGFGGDESEIRDGKNENGTITFKVVREFNGNAVTTIYTATLSDGSLKGKSETIFARNFEAKRGTP